MHPCRERHGQQQILQTQRRIFWQIHKVCWSFLTSPIINTKKRYVFSAFYISTYKESNKNQDKIFLRQQHLHMSMTATPVMSTSPEVVCVSDTGSHAKPAKSWSHYFTNANPQSHSLQATRLSGLSGSDGTTARTGGSMSICFAVCALLQQDNLTAKTFMKSSLVLGTGSIRWHLHRKM